jgi:hypothetical protein
LIPRTLGFVKDYNVVSGSIVLIVDTEIAEVMNVLDECVNATSKQPFAEAWIVPSRTSQLVTD